MSNKVVLSVILLCCSKAALFQKVLVEPSSRLVPVGTETYFTCIIGNAQDPHWKVNSTEASTSFQQSWLSTRGFFIMEEELNGNTTLTLRVDTSYVNVNNTKIACRDIMQITSTTVYLLIINDSPVSPNPSLKQYNSIKMSILWSPPFLWPGKLIDFYNISIRNHDDDNVTHHVMNAYFDDRVVEYMLVQENHRNCSQFTVGISAIVGTQELQSFYISGGYASYLTSFEVSATVLFRSNGIPNLVNVFIKLPKSLCEFQESNYTVFIEDDGRRLLTVKGPIEHHGSGSIEHYITYTGLKTQQKYLARVEIDTRIGNSTNHSAFDTNFEIHDAAYGNTVVVLEDNTFPYKIGIGICLGILILAVLMGICLCCRKLLHDRYSHKATLNQRRKSLIPNPIYDGQIIYETIPQTSFDTLELIKHRDKASMEAAEVDILPCGNTPSSHVSQIRYVDKPFQMSNPLNAAVDDNNIELCAERPEKEVSPLNCPTLENTLKSDVTEYTASAFKSSHVSIDQDTYKVMSPFGIISPSLSDGWDESSPEKKRNPEQ